MLVGPIQIFAVRSYWIPLLTEKSATRMTFPHGAGQFAGGVYEKVWALKSANLSLSKRTTWQGLVFGCCTGGSAMAVLEEPIVRPAKARGEDTARSKTRNAADFEKRESITGASWKLMRQVLVGAWVLREK